MSTHRHVPNGISVRRFIARPHRVEIIHTAGDYQVSDWYDEPVGLPVDESITLLISKLEAFRSLLPQMQALRDSLPTEGRP